MPVYEYHCEAHGTFQVLRPMSAYADPCECPHCGASCPRVLATAPSLGARDRNRMKAHAINERSADSPRRASGDEPRGRLKSPSRAVRAPDGSKCIPSSRPWMIS